MNIYHSIFFVDWSIYLVIESPVRLKLFVVNNLVFVLYFHYGMCIYICTRCFISCIIRLNLIDKTKQRC